MYVPALPSCSLSPCLSLMVLALASSSATHFPSSQTDFLKHKSGHMLTMLKAPHCLFKTPMVQALLLVFKVPTVWPCWLLPPSYSMLATWASVCVRSLPDATLQVSLLLKRQVLVTEADISSREPSLTPP
jgi:hypothetical protein